MTLFVPSCIQHIRFNQVSGKLSSSYKVVFQDNSLVQVGSVNKHTKLQISQKRLKSKVQAQATQKVPKDGNKKDIYIHVDNTTDSSCTTIFIRGVPQEEYLAMLSQSLTKLDLYLQLASIQQQDDFFKIQSKDGKQLSDEQMSELKQSLVSVVGSSYSSHPMIYGSTQQEQKESQVAIQPEEASKLEKAATEMAQAAKDIVDIEKQQKEVKQKEPQQGLDMYNRLREASANLERKIAAVEAIIAVRRNEQEQVTQVEKIKEQDMATKFMPPPQQTTGPAAGNGYEILLQTFNWESKRGHKWYQTLIQEAKETKEAGISAVWLPPLSKSVSEEGYLPTDYYDFNTSYGTEVQMRECVHTYRDLNIKVIADIVINHRCASYQKNGIWNQYGGRLAWDETAICSDNPRWKGKGARSTGDDYPAAPNVDHTNKQVQKDLIDYLKYLRQLGFDGWRFDYVKGYGGKYVKLYIDSSVPYMAFGEYWDSCEYSGGVLSFNQDAHRQRTINWIDSTQGTSAAFDFTTKGILQEAVGRQEYWRLVDSSGRPPGLIGLWPSRAVTFVENHDTGSTLNHWPFPNNRLCEGYAYILLHPGTPCLFYDHFWSRDRTLKDSIRKLVKIRQQYGVNAQSKVAVRRARAEVYACTIDDKVALKIGPGDWFPGMDNVNVGQKDWKLETSGPQFAVWSAQF